MIKGICNNRNVNKELLKKHGKREYKKCQKKPLFLNILLVVKINLLYKKRYN
jgi:hypothetical protein